MTLLDQYFAEYSGRTAVLVLPIDVTITSSASGTEQRVYFRKGTRGLLTGDIVLNSGIMSKRRNTEQEVLVANAVVELYDKRGKKHEVLVPFQFFILE